MKRSYRDNKPRFHKHRQGKMLLPHNQLSGLFFTVNPRQESRAQREAQLYLSSLTPDLEAAQEAFTCSTDGQIAAKCGDSAPFSSSGEDAVVEAPSASLSSLLAAELAACSTQDQRGNRYNSAKRPRTESDAVGSNRGDADAHADDDDDESGNPSAHKQRQAPQRRSEWFAPLETGCKGYLFLNVPIVNAKVTCPTCHAGTNASALEGDENGGVPSSENEVAGGAPSATAGNGGCKDSGAMAPHTIVVNPLVSRITERIFEDLAANPRPIFRNCFRLMPAELTCCPTPPEMQTALRKLLDLHFSPATASQPVVSAEDAVDFHQPIPLPAWGAEQPRRSMHTIALQFTVKNNTNVEQKKASLVSELAAAIPANRFIVVAHPSSKTKCVVEATVCIFVAHATCVMGLQRRVTERRGFNLHAVGEEAFVLSNAVRGSRKEEEQ
ncbi:hypothetical protein ABB37_00256 [Leptomonas pyrrhocoris]|uniref:Uncharacterized protein n=1 Tax=Leptomonas pyrrhocoris TaxID=157538 RepID=A0A0M9G9Z4_LEPPY|nr:hypothetical protein ABB37_00256 [Leptomonas pyrrhocoris]KPA85960.1 hypothetical protein ABB37_00256 [Leptomonas pyrrhocoris]|eukprot:XP_015664399.1 hypothetical protein ABB37_00256 [Leptomonas pyrrhocoris]